MSVPVSDWFKCYGEGWGTRLRPASYSHPAKASYALTMRIYEHALEEGWIKPGDYVVDCFAGIGGFALEAMRHGLNFVGCELEQRFVDMGQGCDCTGISKEDWVRYQGRWDRMRYEDGRHWCPECLMKAGAMADEREFKPLPLPGTKWAVLAKTRQATLFDAAPPTPYVRNSGKIPCTEPHHYRGNIETWEQDGMPGTAVIVQGDSRRLGEVLERAELCLSSPPYTGFTASDAGFRPPHARAEFGRNEKSPSSVQMADESGYGQTAGNLGNMPNAGFEAARAEQGHTVTPKTPGNEDAQRASQGAPSEAQESVGQPVLAVSSPAWMGSDMRKGGSDLPRDNRVRTGRNPDAPGTASLLSQSPYGDEPGQLAQMSEGSFDLAVSSPVYHSNTASADPDKRGGLYCDPKRRGDKTLTKAYSADEVQLAQMPEGDLALTISSPPFIGSIHEGGHGIDAEKLAGNKAGPNSQALIMDGYGREPGQLAALPEGDHAEACLPVGTACERPAIAISSPPWEATNACEDPNYRTNRTTLGGPLHGDYGQTGGQLGQMPPGDHAAALEAGAEMCVSSPPFMEQLPGGKKVEFGERPDGKAFGAGRAMLNDYGSTAGPLGQETGSTFWAASRQILEQVYQVLAPGGHAIWVLKMFVRSGKLVDFPRQWETLCQSVGFKTVCKHRAWLNKNAGVTQIAFDGEEVSMEKWFKSFFRRLCESKGSPRIDWELVLCMEKPQ